MQELYKEIHTLASRYHWSEKEILSMPTQKRKTYLKLIVDESTLNSEPY